MHNPPMNAPGPSNDRRSRTADRLRPFGTTIFAEITARAVETGSVNLGQGMPDFDGPGWLRDLAAEARRAGPNQYAPMAGLPELRRALAGRWAGRSGLACDPDAEVTVTSGCTEALAACALGLLNPGDRVVVFEPYYDAYPADLALAGAEAVFVALRAQADGSFVFDEAELRSACAGARAIMVNTPHNPTGKVFSTRELTLIASLCVEHDLIVLSDEVYETLVYGGAEHVRLATLPGMRDRTITLGSFGKMFSVTGWKIGWAIGPAALSAAVRGAHQFLTFAVPTALQRAAASAIEDDRGYGDELRARLMRSRDRLSEALRATGFVLDAPEGGYFILADHTAVCARLGIEPADDRALCAHLMETVGVATIPPTAFYRHPQHGRRLLRFSFCKSDEVLADAIERLAKL